LPSRGQWNDLLVDEGLESLTGFDHIGEQPLLFSAREQLCRALFVDRRGGDLVFVLVEQTLLALDQVAANGRRLRGVGAEDLVDRYQTRYGVVEDLPLNVAQRRQEGEGDPTEESDQDQQDPEAAHDLPPQGEVHRKSILD
jgi:hypothetical protein